MNRCVIKILDSRFRGNDKRGIIPKLSFPRKRESSILLLFQQSHTNILMQYLYQKYILYLLIKSMGYVGVFYCTSPFIQKWCAIL